ncbi:hypothetical protein EX30DRAFT_287280, partial [Ascodesmis nigricans]
TQPPSYRAAASRKTQLHRHYLSLLRSTPLMLLFQHNNVRATEWVALRRELSTQLAKLGLTDDPITPHIKVTILRNGVFDAAVKIADHFDKKDDPLHATSKKAYFKTYKRSHKLKALLSGPIGCVTFPDVSPEHLKVVMDLMFPAGKPMKGLDPAARQGLDKLILMAARVDGHVAGKMGKAEVMDRSKIAWVSALPGYEGLRSQIVAVLQTMGGGDLVRNLESIPVGVVRTLDGHRKNMAGEFE